MTTRMSRRLRTLILSTVIALALLALLLRWFAQPDRLAGLVLDKVGNTLGLEITANGRSEYRLRGTPMLVVRDLVVREPGALPLLRARRVHLALPWSTLRAGGSELTVKRIELDAPLLDLPALQHWLATRPPSEKRLPTLTHGLRIVDGAITNNDESGDRWRIDRIHVDLPSLHADRPLRARLRGRYLDLPLAIPADLAVAIARPQALIDKTATGFATRGRIAIERSTDWRMPAAVALTGPLRLGEDQLSITPARMGMAGRYEAGDTRVPFALGLSGPLRFDEAVWMLAPAGVTLRGRGEGSDDPIPMLDARGSLAFGQRLRLQLDGAIQQWPDAWPALPPPLGQSRSKLPFALRYDGQADFADVATLQLRRDDTRFDGRFRLPQVLDWLDQAATASPLPPLTGTLTMPKLEISGATLEGVEIEFSDEESAAVAP